MNKEMIEKWIEALRSGEYKQGQRFLRVDTDEGPRYCCLGVLADLIGCSWKPTSKWEPGGKDGTGIQAAIAPGEGESVLSPYMTALLHENNLWERYGFGRHVPQHVLTGLNDSGMTFDEIANRIEEMMNRIERGKYANVQEG